MEITHPIIAARFWSKVNVGPNYAGCWEWSRSTRKDGYGKMKVGRVLVSAHRLAWELFNGEALGDRLALHRCNNPKCCNPKHIYAGSRSENQVDILNSGGRVHDKLTQEDADEIRKYLAMGVSHASLAKDFNVAKTTISKVGTNRIWPERR